MTEQHKKVHFIGICGVGTSGVAKLLQDKGYEVTGSDEGFYPPVSDYLEKIKIPISVGYRKENVPSDVLFVVIGKNAKLVPETNEEVRYVFENNIPVKSFPEVLQELTKDTHNIVCAGSYGKSTCTSIMTWCLSRAEKDPSFFIGALPLNLPYTSHAGKSKVFILEGDEYPSSNTDPSSKFLYYNAHDVLLTSVEHDHVNVFETQEAFSKTFVSLISSIPSDGLLVAHNDDKEIQKIVRYASSSVVTYGFEGDADWTASNVVYGERSSFDLLHHNEKIISLSTTLLGQHNVENIVGVSAMLLEKGLLTPEELRDGVATFEGIVRRLDKKTKTSSVPVYEGFGSSYTKAKAAIDAMKLHFPHKRLVVIFEPHTFSWRNKRYIHHYDTIFRETDKVLIYKPAEQGSATHEQLTQEEILKQINNADVHAEGVSNEKDGLDFVEREIMDGDVVLLLTSGNLDGMVQSIPRLLDEKFRN